MSTVRAGQPGATRVCPHCKATVLESAAICPGCRHHLRFATAGQQLAAVEGHCAFSVDGTIAHKLTGEPCEYCIVLDISNERGEQIMRQVVGVGALQPGELRHLNLSVDMLPLATQLAKAQAAQPSPATRQPAPTAAAAGTRSAVPSASGARPAAAAPTLPPPVRTPPPVATKPGTTAVTGSAGSATTAAPGSVARTLTPSPGSGLGQRSGLFRKP